MLAHNNHPELDEQDQAILDERLAAFEQLQGPRVGDYIELPSGEMRRIAFLTNPDWAPEVDFFQPTSPGTDGSFYFGNGYVSHSGSLDPGGPRALLKLTTKQEYGPVWFFHHDYARAHNGVTVQIPFRVYQCNEELR